MAPSRLVYRYHISEDEIFMDTAIRTSFLKNCWFYFSNGMKESFYIVLVCVMKLYNFFFFWRVPTFRSRNWKFLRKWARTFQATSRHNQTDHKMNLYHRLNLKSRKIFFVLSNVILNFIPNRWSSEERRQRVVTYRLFFSPSWDVSKSIDASFVLMPGTQVTKWAQGTSILYLLCYSGGEGR